MASTVALLETSPETVIADYGRAMRMAGYREALSDDHDTILKLNLSWTKYYPACSTQPWQLDGVLAALRDDGVDMSRVIPVENKTVVTDPWVGAHNNRWLPVLDRYELDYVALPEVEWEVFPFESPLLKLNDIFPEGIRVPTMYRGKNIVHLPTVKTHGHSITTGAIKNAFGGLLQELRHYAHEFIHEVMVDLLYMQRELHPGVFAVMDGAVAGDGAGPRTMIPRVMNCILASADQVAIDAVAAQLMGFDPMEIPYLRMCHERGLGCADPRDIEVVGAEVERFARKFETKRSFVIWGDQMIRRGPLRPLRRMLLHSPLMVWAPFASNVYHDSVWYPTVGRRHIREFEKTGWGKLWQTYPAGPEPARGGRGESVKWQRHAVR
jgi:uncharacterized protein (DUF362 family)